MAVGTYALTTVDDVLLQLGMSRNELQVVALDVWDDTSDSTSATVQATLAGLTLIITGGASAGTTSVTWAGNVTVTAVVAAINAASGWSARVLLGGSADSTNIEPLVQTGAKGYASRVEIGILNVLWVETLIDAASARVEQYIGRNILSRSYKQWLNGSGRQWLRLPQRPLTAVSRLAIGARAIVSIENTSSDAVSATANVRINSSGETDAILLTVVGGANAGTDTLTWASYATISALETAIEALDNGWDVIQQDLPDIPEGTIPTTDMRPQPAIECLDFVTYLYVPDRNEEFYSEEPDRGRLWLPPGSCFPGEPRDSLAPLSTYAEYTAGEATVPADIQLGTTRLAATAFHQAGVNTALRSETLGPWEYVLNDMAKLDAALMSAFDSYQERSV